MNFRNASRLFAAIICSASAVSIEAKINAAATATATDTTISSKDIKILRSGDSKIVEFKEKFWLTEGEDVKDIQKFKFILQNDGNVVLYRFDDGGDRAIWASDTHCNNCDLTLWLQEDGSLSLRHTGSNNLLWSTYTGGYGTYPYEFVMPDPGFPMVVDKYGRKIWAADQTESFCNKSYYYAHTQLVKVHCHEPHWSDNDPFVGNWLHWYDEYEVEIDGDMKQTAYLYAEETKMNYQGWHGIEGE